MITEALPHDLFAPDGPTCGCGKPSQHESGWCGSCGAARVVTFEVFGTPAPKGSMRAFVNKRTGRALVVPSGSDERKAKLKSWDAAVRVAALAAIEYAQSPPFVRVPLVLTVEYRLARPKGHWGKRGLLPSAPRFPIGKPDGDKLARQSADSLTGIVWDDDARIVSWRVDKAYAEPGREGATFTVQEAT